MTRNQFLHLTFLFITMVYSLSISQELPLVIMDESASSWTYETFAGNETAGPVFFQGPKLEVPLYYPSVPVTTPDGTSYLIDRNGEGLMECSPEGKITLLMGKSGLLEGPIEECAYGTPIWNKKDSTLYLSGPNCLRKVTTRQDGTQWVEVVAGIPNVSGTLDGPAKSATFPLRCLGLACDSQGVFYWLHAISKRPGGMLRRIKKDSVTTLPLIFDDSTEGFNWAMGEGDLSGGENDKVLYISDFFNFRILKYDIPSGKLTHICGVPDDSTDVYSRFGQNADGPALTHVSANSGIRCLYDPFYRNLWVGGPDENRIRWLILKDNYVKTVMNDWRGVTGLDNQGGVFLLRSPYNCAFRAYNRITAR